MTAATIGADINIKFSSKLEKLTDGNWIKWSREVRMALRAQRAYKCSSENTWLEVNDQIVGALGTIVDEPFQRELDSIINAKKAWDKLREKTQPKGLISKLENMQVAIKNRFSLGTPVSSTIIEIRDSLSAVFENGARTSG
ncbi:hypothetical protein M422DRAFT_51994 [Sphaerobolus stellatus SS14]|uniref:Unplaced genomic scaffold SPHSTscaffold_124, whole genome shotgun sequence n=1 Tax=Sphaerobolus stellatus (strain SS14) TaxID=990650 RepID=A0A0C9TVU9_SPHS4|nr:hypothetical protein M422DRAFT_51994 [Sphaerobolus stellatus SS14]